MDNYKIKVNDEAESKEAQDLFFELGCEWRDSKKDISNLDAVYIYADDEILTFGFNEFNFRGSANTELTLPQLRDLVVLHRNDVRDATHENSFIQGLYKGDSWYVFHDDKWNYIGKELGYEPIKLNQDKPEQGLISGADALNDYSNAQVSYDFGNGEYKWFPLDQCEFSIPQILKGHNDAYDSFALAKLIFRLKPRTITLNVEIPAPFEPKDGEIFWFVSPYTYKGYDSKYFVDDCTGFLLNGVWRTEEEIKQVVAALRGGIKG